MCSNCVAAIDLLQCSWAHGAWSSCLTSRSQAHYIGPRLGFKSAGAQGPLLNSKRSSCCYGDCKPRTVTSRDFPHAWLNRPHVLLKQDQPYLWCCLPMVMCYLIFFIFFYYSNHGYLLCYITWKKIKHIYIYINKRLSYIKPASWMLGESYF